MEKSVLSSDKTVYEAPSIEICHVVVEKGFASSTLEAGELEEDEWSY